MTDFDRTFFSSEKNYKFLKRSAFILFEFMNKNVTFKYYNLFSNEMIV